MQKLSWMTCSLLAFCASTALAADSGAAAEAKAAAKKLGTQGNYSWTSTTKIEGGGGGGGGNFRAGPTEGQADKEGWIHTSQTFNDNKIETYLKAGKGAVKREDEWQTLEDLEGDERGQFMARRIKAFKAPAVEAEELAGLVKELKKGADGSLSGDLTDEGAKGLLTRTGRRQGGSEPTGSKGSAKFWVKDGVLSKYEYQVQGSFKRDDGEERKVDRTTTVEIKEVGTTKLTVPAEVKKKLS